MNSFSDSTAPLAVSDWTWGIDTVRIALPVDIQQCDPQSVLWHSSSSRNLRNSETEADAFAGSHFVTTPHGTEKIRVFLYTGSATCHLEFNAARIVSSDRLHLLPPDALQSLVHGLIDELRHSIWPAFVQVTEDGEALWADDWAARVKFKRLDLARNFTVSDPDLVKAALDSVQSRHQRERVNYRSRKAGWTITNTTKTGGHDKIYDKAAELEDCHDTHLTSADGLFRFEAQIKGDRLNTLGIARLSDLNELSAWNALLHRWSQTRWGSPLPSPDGLLQAVQRLPIRQQCALVGYLHFAAEGMTSRFTESQQRTLRKHAKACGLTPGMPVHLLGVPRQRLDLFHGCLVPLTDEERLGASIPV